jgi:uncharacterized protein
MLERDGYPTGVPCWIDTGRADPEAAASFYGDLFAWEFENRMPADSPDRYFVAQLGGRDVAGIGSQTDASSAPVWNTYIWVESADDAAARAERAGGSVVEAPFDVGDAGRMAVLADPAGAAFCVWQANRHRGAQVVNEPGTWNWSDLNTRDEEGSRAFYGEVFGWEADTVDLGGTSGTMWRRPGYGDVLEQNNPGIRSRHEQGGAPEGFTDAIGWMMLMSSDQSPDDAGPHWHVTFSVDNTDAIAERAMELGGEVLVPPFDAGPTRVAILRDPDGAAFTVSKYEGG